MNIIKVSLALILIAQLSGCKLPPPSSYPESTTQYDAKGLPIPVYYDAPTSQCCDHYDNGITASEIESILYNRERADYNLRFKTKQGVPFDPHASVRLRSK